MAVLGVGVGFFSPFFYGYVTSGHVKLPSLFVEEHGSKLPDHMYLELPTGDLWAVKYVGEKSTLEGLGGLIQFYKIKPYHIAFFKYTGGAILTMSIFSPYGVEIDYPLRTVAYNQAAGCATCSTMGDVEVDKWESTLRYNACNWFATSVDVIIEPKHLRRCKAVKMMAVENAFILGISPTMSLIKIRSEHFMWNIGLEWSSNHLHFSSGWYRMVRGLNLRVGDMFILSKLPGSYILKIAVFSFSEVPKASSVGDVADRLPLKCMKILDESSLASGILEMPRMFVASLGVILPPVISLYLNDGKKFVVEYCSKKFYLGRLRPLFDGYSMGVDYVVVLMYIGRDTFFLSMYTDKCVNLIDPDKVTVSYHDISVDNDIPVEKLEPTVPVGTAEEVEVISAEIFYGKTVATAKNPVQQPDKMEVSAAAAIIQLSGSFYFCAKMLPCHVDSRGYGVYFDRSTMPLYSRWKRFTQVTMKVGVKCWKVRANRNNQSCKFGRGWSRFIRDNAVNAGDYLGVKLKDGAEVVCEVIFL